MKSTRIPVIVDGNERFQFRKQLYRVSKLVLLSTLGILVVTTSLRLWLDAKLQETSASLIVARGTTEKSRAVEMKLSQLTQSYDEIGWEQNAIPLYYADQLGISIPKGLKLTELTIGSPAHNADRFNKRNVFNRTHIDVKGEVSDPTLLQEWVATLEGMAWVAEIRDQRYTFNARERKGLFELKLLTRE